MNRQWERCLHPARTDYINQGHVMTHSVQCERANVAALGEAEVLCPLIFYIFLFISGCRQSDAEDVIGIALTSQ